MFPFNDAENTAAISCLHVMRDNKPILYASHDPDDGMWQFLCGGPHNAEDALMVSLGEIYKKDKLVSEIADLPLGWVATRKTAESVWETHNNVGGTS